MRATIPASVLGFSCSVLPGRPASCGLSEKKASFLVLRRGPESAFVENTERGARSALFLLVPFYVKALRFRRNDGYAESWRTWCRFWFGELFPVWFWLADGNAHSGDHPVGRMRQVPLPGQEKSEVGNILDEESKNHDANRRGRRVKFDQDFHSSSIHFPASILCLPLQSFFLHGRTPCPHAALHSNTRPPPANLSPPIERIHSPRLCVNIAVPVGGGQAPGREKKSSPA